VTGGNIPLADFRMHFPADAGLGEKAGVDEGVVHCLDFCDLHPGEPWAVDWRYRGVQRRQHVDVCFGWLEVLVVDDDDRPLGSRLLDHRTRWHAVAYRTRYLTCTPVIGSQ
jgi:hypothetical protein